MNSFCIITLILCLKVSSISARIRAGVSLGSSNNDQFIENYFVMVTKRLPQIPADYINVPGTESWLKLYRQVESWAEARVRCIQDGGHLAIIRNEAELKYILALTGSRRGKLWLGYHNSGEYKGAITITDVRFSVIGYGAEPIYNERYLCGILDVNAAFSYASCDDVAAYFCKIEPE